MGKEKRLLIILVGLFLVTLVQASNVTVWQGQSYSGIGFNTGDHDFNFTVYNNLTGTTACYDNTTTLTLGVWGQWKTEQYNVWANCNNATKDYFLNINIDGDDQGTRRRLTVQDFLRRDVNDIMQENITADWGFMNINWSNIRNDPLSNYYPKTDIDANLSLYYPKTDIDANMSNYILTSEEGNLNTNGSDYWDNMDSINTTQMENSGGVLNILVSWFTEQFNSLFGDKTTDDLTEGTSNRYDNESWNVSESLEIHYTKSEADTNSSLYLLLTNQKFNETDLANSINSTINIMNLGFYNETALDINFSLYYTKSETDTNSSLYLLLTNQKFNDTALINSVNTSDNIKALGFYDKTTMDTNLSLYYPKTDIDNNFSLYYPKTDIDANLSLYYPKTDIDANMSNYILRNGTTTNITVTGSIMLDNNATITRSNVNTSTWISESGNLITKFG